MKKIIAVSLVLLAVHSYAQTIKYHLLKKVAVPGNGNWDYLSICPVNNNLYISHETEVNIIDRSTGKVIDDIQNTTGVHGIAFAASKGKGYITDGKLNKVTIFDIKTNKTLGVIPVGEKPDAIMYDEFSGNIYVCNGKSHSVSVIDPVSDKVLHTISLGGKPETAVTDKNGKIYVNLEDKNAIAVINLKTFTVEKLWSLGRGEAPSGLAIDIKTKRLFAGCDNKMLVVIDATNGNRITQLPIGDECDGVAFDNDLKNIFSANGDGTLSIIHEDSPNSYKLVQNVPTQVGARTLTLDEKTHHVFLPVADFSNNKSAGHHRDDIKQGTFHVLIYGR